MLDIGWSEMLLIAVVAIIVIGPKDLPKALRAVGQWVGKARSIAREFQSSVDQMIADAELDDMKKAANAIGNARPDTFVKQQLEDIVDGTDGGAKPASSNTPDATEETASPAPTPVDETADYHPPDDASGAEPTTAAAPGNSAATPREA